MRSLRAIAALCIACAIAPLARAQSFNIDYFDGAGVAAETHGAAANQFGFWNNLLGPAAGNEPLRNLTGDTTDVFVAVFNSQGRTEGFLPGLPSDVEPLLRDNVFTNDNNMWLIFSNLQVGDYEVYTYHTGFGLVDVWYGTDSSTKTPITGEWTGAYQVGKTHSLHVVNVDESGELRINMTGADDVYINGMQIRLVPTPASAVLFASAASFLAIRRRR